ncbi:hypothetical protein [Methylobacterium crusticola]|uniref:hypothetical protein n=1 Tax=Methylobacterium crusticola TaxID=1697972 RepID=UPI001EE33780|nr:hypothetical protein [Methylobacterium crusticola]
MQARASGVASNPSAPPLDPQTTTSCPVEAIAAAYLRITSGDPSHALRCAITDALADLMEAERRIRERSRVISKGNVRGAVDDAP